MILNRYQYWIALALIALVYMAGLFVTLFENDSAQFAVMAMRMVKEQDFLSLYKGTEEYLDKPHMHYWLAAFSYLLFGISEWAYRIPGLLVTALGAYSVYGLGKLLYRKEVGRLAALIFLTAQTIILSGIDLRTDAVLTGFTAFAMWQLVAYLKEGKFLPLLLGAAGAGLAFSTKGQIALLVLGLPLLCYIAHQRKWNRVFHWKVIIALGVFLLVISPMLYAYYHQFDLHPEKVIRGRSNRSGILFIFWEQSFERLSGEGIGKNSSDYFFFFHTFLWVFLPWTIAGLLAYGSRLRQLLKPYGPRNPEYLTLGGITLIFIIISFAQFKLPHYLNITIPLFAILSGAFLLDVYERGRRQVALWLLGFQYFILGLVVLASLAFCFYVFPGARGAVLGVIVLSGSGFLLWWTRKKTRIEKVVLIALGSAILLNLVMNLHFYPRLLNYQAGSTMAYQIKEAGLPTSRIYKLSEEYTWSLDFYLQDPVARIAISEVGGLSDAWLYVGEQELEELRSMGLHVEVQMEAAQFRITRLQARFLNPETRQEILNRKYLVYLP